MARSAGARPTIADVAAAAGVSRTTVSHALNGVGRVDPSTRQRVQRIAADLGYRPSLRAQRLRAGAARTVALVSSMPFAVAGGPSRLGFFMEVAAAAAETALTHGYALVLVPPTDGRPPLDYLDIDGAIVVEPEEQDPTTADLLGRGLPVVTLGRQPGADVTVPYVDLQAPAVGRLLLDHLYEQGARHIALVVGTSRRHSYVDIAATYRDFAKQHAMPSVVIAADEGSGEDAGYAACADLLRRHPDTDAVCAVVDAFAVGAVRAIRDAGRRVPDDVLVATRYDGLRARTCDPPLTSVTLHLGRVASAAVEMLLARLEGADRPCVARLPEPALVPRRSSVGGLAGQPLTSSTIPETTAKRRTARRSRAPSSR